MNMRLNLSYHRQDRQWSCEQIFGKPRMDAGKEGGIGKGTILLRVWKEPIFPTFF